jgi:hypothetical protein
MTIFSIITEEERGSIETTAELIKTESGLHIKMLWAKDLNTGESVYPCSAERFAEYLNNCQNTFTKD